MGGCFIQLWIGKKTFRDSNSNRKFEVQLHFRTGIDRTNRFGTGYSSTGRHYITVNGEMLAQSVLQTTTDPILKGKGKVTLHPISVSTVGVKTPTVPETNNLYE